MKKELFHKLLIERAEGDTWLASQHPSKKRDLILRLHRLADHFIKEGWTIKEVEEGLNKAEVVSPKCFPADSVIKRCIQTIHEAEKKRQRSSDRNFSPADNFKRWQQEMARCKQWNKEHHEDIIQDRAKPKMADPAIAFGKKS